MKFTLYKLKLSAYRCSTIIGMIWLRFSRPTLTIAKPLRALFPESYAVPHTFKNQTGYNFYTREGHLENFEMWR